MEQRKFGIALLAFLLAGAAMVPCVIAAENGDAKTRGPVIISIAISINGSENSSLNQTTENKIKPLNPAPSSNMKKIKVPELNESAEQHHKGFSDRDWAFIRKSMTDLTEREQDLLIAEWKMIVNNTSSLNPDEQANVSLRMGYYIINATDKGRPVDPQDLPALPKEKPVKNSAPVPVIVPMIALGGCSAIRLLLLRKK